MTERDVLIATILSDKTGTSQAWLTSLEDQRGQGLPSGSYGRFYRDKLSRVSILELERRAAAVERETERRAEAKAAARVAQMKPAVVPTLHELCCRFVCNEDVYLSTRSVLDVFEFATMWNVAELQQRAEGFVASTFPTLVEMHGSAVLEQALGEELHATLVAAQEEAAQGRRRLSLVGEVLEKPAVEDAVLEPTRTESGRDTWPYEQLRTGVAWPDGVGPNEREQWLSNDEFATVFGMPRERFVSLPKWKQATLRKEKDLY